MAFGSIIRFGGRVAVFAAMAALLLQVSCTIGLTPSATAELTQPADSGCHHSVPATPDAPNSGQKCCNGEHSPEALLPASPVAATPLATAEPVHGLFDSDVSSRHEAEIATPSTGPPWLLALRI